MIPSGQLIDLTLTYDERISGVKLESASTVEKNGWNAKMLHIYSHSGTHMDAPYHFGVTDRTIDDFEPKDFIGKAYIAKVPVEKSGYLITIDDLGEIAERVGEGDSLIIQTGWSKYVYENPSKYRNELPGISEELALWIVDKKIKMLGVEPPSVADVNDLPVVTRIHQILLGGNIVIIEGLTNLEQITNNIVTLMAFPLKIKDGDGAPARVVVVDSYQSIVSSR